MFKFISASSTPPRVVGDSPLVLPASATLSTEPASVADMAGMTHVISRSKDGNRRKHQHTGAEVAAGGKDFNISKSFRIDGAYPAMNRKLSPYNQIRVQSTTNFTGYHTTSASVPSYNSLVISLTSDVPNYAAYTAVFDQYRIERVEAWIIPNGNSTAPASSNGGAWTTAVDYDDGNTPTAFTQVSDKQTALTTGVLAGHYHSWVPQYATAAYSGTFVSFSAERGWVDSASPSVQHYGLKLAASPTINTGTITYDAIVRCTIAFRGAGIS
jgi:hypothetical protein